MPYISKASQARLIHDTVVSEIERCGILEPTLVYTPAKYTIAGAGYLNEDTAVGDTTIVINTYPAWASEDSIWLLIDSGNDECEARKVKKISGIYCMFEDGLDYTHSEGDVVVFLDKPVLNVKFWGTKGNNTTNDFLSLRRALTQAEIVSRTGTVIYIPAGVYRVDGGMEMVAILPIPDGVKVVGDGTYNTVLIFDSDMIPDAVSMGSRTEISNMTLQVKVEPSQFIQCIDVDAKDSVVITQLYIIAGETWNCIEVENSTNVEISYCLITSSNYNKCGIYIYNSTGIDVHNTEVQYARTYSFMFDDVENLKVINNESVYMRGVGPAYTDVGFHLINVRNFTVAQNRSSTADTLPVGYGYYFDCSHGVIHGNAGSHNTNQFGISPTNFQYVEFDGNYWSDSATPDFGVPFATIASRAKFFDRVSTTLTVNDFSLTYSPYTPPLAMKQRTGVVGADPPEWLLYQGEFIGAYFSAPYNIFGGYHRICVVCDTQGVNNTVQINLYSIDTGQALTAPTYFAGQSIVLSGVFGRQILVTNFFICFPVDRLYLLNIGCTVAPFQPLHIAGVTLIWD